MELRPLRREGGDQSREVAGFDKGHVAEQDERAVASGGQRRNPRAERRAQARREIGVVDASDIEAAQSLGDALGPRTP